MFKYINAQLSSMLFIAPMMLLAIVCHECAHGWVSDRLGDPTPRNSGRLTLNPFKHLDLMGALCMLVFKIGWAKPVPINPWYYKNRKKGIILVSLAGPVSNFIVALLSLFGMGIIMKVTPGYSVWIGILYQVFYYSAILNIGLGVFNLIPIPPLDGSKVAEELSPKMANMYQQLQKYWRFILFGLLVTGLLSRPLSFLNGRILELLWFFVRGALKI